MHQNIVIMGSNGAIGSAMTQKASELYPDAMIHAFSRTLPEQKIANVIHKTIDCANEQSLTKSAALASEKHPIDLIIVAVGILHDEVVQPEKSLADLSEKNFEHCFQINTIIPAMICKHFLPKMNKQSRSVFAALSARVGSISDNQLGGWYAYRASKSALNMILKCAAIETARINKQAIVVGLHPGTVDSKLSKPFQGNVPNEKLFSAAFSANKMFDVLSHISTQDTGKCFAWNGIEVMP